MNSKPVYSTSPKRRSKIAFKQPSRLRRNGDQRLIAKIGQKEVSSGQPTKPSVDGMECTPMLKACMIGTNSLLTLS